MTDLCSRHFIAGSTSLNYTFRALNTGAAVSLRCYIMSPIQENEAARFIAEDFIGVSSKARRYSKAEALKEIAESKGVFSTFVATGITVRVYGDAAVAQGTDVWVLADPSKKGGSSLWTDTWIRVQGKWRLVSAQDILPP